MLLFQIQLVPLHFGHHKGLCFPDVFLDASPSADPEGDRLRVFWAEGVLAKDPELEGEGDGLDGAANATGNATDGKNTNGLCGDLVGGVNGTENGTSVNGTATSRGGVNCTVVGNNGTATANVTAAAAAAGGGAGRRRRALQQVRRRLDDGGGGGVGGDGWSAVGGGPRVTTTTTRRLLSVPIPAFIGRRLLQQAGGGSDNDNVTSATTTTAASPPPPAGPTSLGANLTGLPLCSGTGMAASTTATGTATATGTGTGTGAGAGGGDGSNITTATSAAGSNSNGTTATTTQPAAAAAAAEVPAAAAAAAEVPGVTCVMPPQTAQDAAAESARYDAASLVVASGNASMAFVSPNSTKTQILVVAKLGTYNILVTVEDGCFRKVIETTLAGLHSLPGVSRLVTWTICMPALSGLYLGQRQQTASHSGCHQLNRVLTAKERCENRECRPFSRVVAWNPMCVQQEAQLSALAPLAATAAMLLVAWLTAGLYT
jgi:hypothetical protein